MDASLLLLYSRMLSHYKKKFNLEILNRNPSDLFASQYYAITKMKDIENIDSNKQQDYTHTTPVDTYKFKSNIGFLNMQKGSGKTRTVCGHLHLNPLPHPSATYHEPSYEQINVRSGFSTKKQQEIKIKTVSANLIFVSDFNFSIWEEELTRFNLSYLKIYDKKTLDIFISLLSKNKLTAGNVLISKSSGKYFTSKLLKCSSKYKFDRLFIDNPTTDFYHWNFISPLNFRFLWFITPDIEFFKSIRNLKNYSWIEQIISLDNDVFVNVLPELCVVADSPEESHPPRESPLISDPSSLFNLNKLMFGKFKDIKRITYELEKSVKYDFSHPVVKKLIGLNDFNAAANALELDPILQIENELTFFYHHQIDTLKNKILATNNSILISRYTDEINAIQSKYESSKNFFLHNTNESVRQNPCSICLETVETNQSPMLLAPCCRNNFCLYCIVNYVNKNINGDICTCPICRDMHFYSNLRIIHTKNDEVLVPTTDVGLKITSMVAQTLIEKYIDMMFAYDRKGIIVFDISTMYIRTGLISKYRQYADKIFSIHLSNHQYITENLRKFKDMETGVLITNNNTLKELSDSNLQNLSYIIVVGFDFNTIRSYLASACLEKWDNERSPEVIELKKTTY